MLLYGGELASTDEFWFYTHVVRWHAKHTTLAINANNNQLAYAA